jgi:alpha-L-rhamnosidase
MMRANYFWKALCVSAACFAVWGECVTAEIAAPAHLQLNGGFKNPIGFHDATPSFSWQLPSGGGVQQQSAYRIVAASAPNLLPDQADLWDSGKVVTDQSVLVAYQGKTLTSGQQVYWQVQFWDETGRTSPWSEPASFELGLLKNSDWKGQWIQMKGQKVFPAPSQWTESDKANPRRHVTIEIISAKYGNPANPEKMIDVAPAIREQCARKDFLLEVSEALARGATVPAGATSLILQYQVDRKDAKATLKKGTKYDLFSRRDYVTLVPEYLRKQFQLEAPVTKARLYVSARGLYELRLNGSRVGRDYLAPGWTTYQSWIETLTYDVTQQVQAGDNVLAATVAEGWYAGRIGAGIGTGEGYTDIHPDLLCQLEVTLANGKQVVIATDESWKATNQGPIRVSSIFDGEVYDARMEMPGWDRAGFDDSKWAPTLAKKIDPAVALVPKEHQAVRITGEIPAVKVTERAPGVFMFDLGQNMVGWPELTIPVRTGETIEARCAEMLETDGALYVANYRTARSADYYTAARNGTVTWHPIFSFHGFRYLELSGFPAGTKADASWVKGLVLHSDFKQIGHFNSSSAMLNQLQKNIIWGQRGNFLDIPSDCPQRDERQGWTGDAQVFCPTSQFNYNTHAFWSSWTRSLRANQNSKGHIPSFVPTARESKKPGSPGWGDVAVTIPWDVYVRSGDRTILEKNYQMMQRWVAAYKSDAKNHIVHRDGYGDWLQPYATGIIREKRDTRVGETAFELIATAYYGRCSAIMQQVATILGKTEDAARYAKQVANIREAFSREFFDQNGKLTTTFETQTGYLMALSYDLLEPKLREAATQNLLRKIQEADGHLRTGFLGTPLLAYVLDQTDHHDIAYQLLFKETYPSWFYPINQGATTMWERWNSYSHQDGFGDAYMNSFNHYAYGAIGQWMYERIAGLAPDPTQPGYKHFFIQPLPGKQLDWANADLETPYGKAMSGWKKSAGKLSIEALVPPNTTATLIVPTQDNATPTLTLSGQPCALVQKNGQFILELKPGSYTFALDWNEI